MRANLKARLTTTCRRASQRVKWRYTKNECWFAVVADEESLQWEPHGIIHRQIGKDGRGHLVWPDQSVHRFSPNHIALYVIPTDSLELAEKVRAQLLLTLREFADRNETWSPAAGMQRGRVVLDRSSVPERVNHLEFK